MVKFEIVETLPYGCATWTLRNGPYSKLRAVHHWILLRILEARCMSSNNRILSYSYKVPFNKRVVRVYQSNHAHEEVIVDGGAVPLG